MTLAVSPGYVTQSAALARSVLDDLGSEPGRTLERHGQELIARLLLEDWLRLADAVRDDDGSLPAAFSWRCGYALHHLGHLAQARDVVRAGREDDAALPDRARLSAMLAAIAWNQGDETDCRRHAARAADLAGDDPGAGAYTWVSQALLAAISGDRDANLRAYDRALAAAEAAGDLISQERIHNNLGSAALEEGRFDDAVDLLTRGLEINDRTHHHSGTAVLRHNLAEAMFFSGRLDEALLEVESARTIWTAIDSPSAGGAWQLAGDIQSARGNAAQAADAYREAVRLGDDQDDVQTLLPALAGLLRVVVAEDPTEADLVLDRLMRLRATAGGAVAHTASGWASLYRGEFERARAHAASAREEAAQHRDRPRLAESLLLATLAEEEPCADDPRLREAVDLLADLRMPVPIAVGELVRAELGRDQLGRQLAADQLRELGVHADAARLAGPLHAARSRRPSPAVRVHTLGRYLIHRDGEPIPSSSWPSRKAREVLGVLAGRGAAGISRPALGALLWPDVDDVGNRLSVALSHLRATLDPEKRHSADHYLIGGRDHVFLDLEHVSVDVVDFEQGAQAALRAYRDRDPRAARMLEAAASLHTGAFMESEPAEEWLLDLQERVERLGREVIEALAAVHAAGPDPAAAVPWLARLLTMDPYDEPTYRIAVSTLWRLGRYGESQRFHRTYALRMAELGVPARTWEDLREGDG
ncbi:hypothetical protein GCM10022215_12580 [Nocardioides fonticola]|uniref:Bacterial transcriptional activator domain-containing protein n=1 Tax=Nocardioides fonticola TaxID=450363 RepID=A0ABP7XF99_9ACTN